MTLSSCVMFHLYVFPTFVIVCPSLMCFTCFQLSLPPSCLELVCLLLSLSGCLFNFPDSAVPVPVSSFPISHTVLVLCFWFGLLFMFLPMFLDFLSFAVLLLFLLFWDFIDLEFSASYH